MNLDLYLHVTKEDEGKFRLSCTNMDNAPYYVIFDDKGFNTYTRSDEKSQNVNHHWKTIDPNGPLSVTEQFFLEKSPERGEIALLKKKDRVVEIEKRAKAKLTELLEKNPVFQRHTSSHGIIYHFEDDRYDGTLKAIYPGEKVPPFYAAIHHLFPSKYSFSLYRWHQNYMSSREDAWFSQCDNSPVRYDTYDEAVAAAEEVLIVLFQEEKIRFESRFSFPNLLGQLNLELTNILNAAQSDKHKKVHEVAQSHLSKPLNKVIDLPEYASLIALVTKNAFYFPLETQPLVWEWIKKASDLMASEVKGLEAEGLAKPE